MVAIRQSLGFFQGRFIVTSLKKFLRRYTNLPALIYLLREQRITLLDPNTWEDKNDSHFLDLYREKKHLGSVLALCFTQATETYHHWRVFASGSAGVCITFKREQLIRSLKPIEGIRTGSVRYLRMGEISRRQPSTEELPFLKRYPFEPENEFRVILDSRQRREAFDVLIPLSCIDRITLSPWLSATLASHVKSVLWNIRGCRELKIVRSTLISNEDWKNFGDLASSHTQRTRKQKGSR